MSSVLQSIMADFGRQAGVAAPQCTERGEVQFLCDGQLAVSLFDDAASGNVHAIGVAGYLPPEHSDGSGDEWKYRHDPAGEDEPAKWWHGGSGALLVEAAAPAATLDSVTFSAWLERFLDQLAEVARQLAAEPQALLSEFERRDGTAAFFTMEPIQPP